MGNSESALERARTMKGRKVSLMPFLAASGLRDSRKARTAVMSHSSTCVTCATVRLDCCIFSAILRRMPEKGTVVSPFCRAIETGA